MHRLLITAVVVLLAASLLPADEPADLPEDVLRELTDLLKTKREATDPEIREGLAVEIRQLLVETLDIDPDREPDRFEAGARPLLREANRRLDAPPPPPPVDPAKLAITLARLRQVRTAAQMHLAEQGTLPEMSDLIGSGLLTEEDVKDGWGQDIRMKSRGDGFELSLISPGPDGTFDTADDVDLDHGP